MPGDQSYAPWGEKTEKDQGNQEATWWIEKEEVDQGWEDSHAKAEEAPKAGGEEVTAFN